MPAITTNDNDKGEGGGFLRRNTLEIASAQVLFTVLACGAAWVMAAGFADLFRGFGGKLPALTRFVVEAYPWFGLPLAVTLVPAIWLFRHRDAGIHQRILALACSSAGTLLAAAALVATGVGGYSPAWEMGPIVEP